MNLEAKTVADIERILARYRKPVVLWSGGKDSTVLLHLSRRMHPDIPAICWREPWFPEKLQFTHRLIELWGIECYDYAPFAVGLCKGNGRIDIMNHYDVGNRTMILARGTEAPEEGRRYLCGRETFLSRPLGTWNFPFDVMLHGHKSCDEDPCSGKVPLQVDLVDDPGACAAFYPLREWTDKDVWEYTERFSVPYDTNRYVKTNGRWESKKDKRKNPDYYHACFKCLDADNGPFVQCPKSGMDINSIADRVSWIKPQMDYCGLRVESKEDHVA